MELKNADFTDDVTTINPNELLGAGEAPNEELDGAPIQQEQNEQEQQQNEQMLQ